MGKSKIVLSDGRVLMDLTADTVEADKLLKGYTAHGADGELVTGTCTYDTNTQDANAKASEILENRTAYVNKNKLTGTMPNIGKLKEENSLITNKTDVITIPRGYHDGTGEVKIDPDEQGKIKPDNIRQGVIILGVEGTMTGTEGEKKQAKEVTPSFKDQTVLPDEGYTCLTQVLVKAIPYSEESNPQGGITVTIG